MKNEKLNTWFAEFKRLNGLKNDDLSAMFGIKIKQNNSAYYRHLRTLKNIVEANFVAPQIEEHEY